MNKCHSSYRRKFKTLFQVHIWAAILIFCFVISGCQTSTDAPNNEALADQSFLTDQPCAGPCWYGITIGESINPEKIKAILKGLPFIDPESIHEMGSVWLDDEAAKFILFDCIVPDTRRYGVCGGITLSKGKVVEINTSFGNHMTVDQVVNKLGKPRFVQHGPWAPEAGGCSIQLIWPDRGIDVSYTNTNDDRACRDLKDHKGLPKTMEVKAISYTEPGIARNGTPNNCNYCDSWPGYLEP